MKERAVGLPSHEIQLFSGIITQYRSEDIGVNGLASAINVDPADIFRGLGKVPGSTRVSDNHGSAVESIHYLEGFDLTGALQRLVITLAGGALYSLNTSTFAITSLATGLTSEAMAGITYNDRLHLASPNNDPRKIDMAGQVSNWGVKPPGTTETALETFASAASFSINGSNTKANSTTAPPSFPAATTSVQVNKIDTTGTSVVLTRTGLSLNFANAGQGFVNVNLFLPAGSIAKLASSGTAVQFKYGNAGLTNANVNTFSIGELQEGWNLIEVGEADSTVGSGATLASVDTIELTITHAAVGTTQSGYLWSYLFTYDEGAPTVATGASADITGTKTYVVTYVSRYGHQSNAGPASDSIVVNGRAVSLTAVPISSDSQVVSRRIYRDNEADEVYRFVGEIFDNTTTTFTDNVADADLELTGPPLAGDPNDDNSPPPRFRDVALYRNHVFGVVEDTPNLLRVSDVDEPESFPTGNEFVFDDEIRGIESIGLAVLVYTADRIYGFNGSTMEDFFVQALNPEVGCAGRRAHANPKGAFPIIFHEDGPWFVFDPQDPWFVGAPIADQIKDLTTTQFENIWMLHDRKRFRVIIFIPGSATTMQKTWCWSYGKRSIGGLSGEGAGLDPTQIRSGGWFELSLPVVPRCAVVSETTADQPEVLIGATDGRVYRLQDTDVTNYATATGSSPISMEIETLDLPLSGDRDGRGSPRYIVVNGRFDVETTLTFTVTTKNDANGKVIATRTWSTVFEAGQQSKVIPVAGPATRASYARIKITNNRANERPILTSVRLIFIPSFTMTGPR